MPRDKDISYAYSELTVPVGEYPLGLYFMANGFGEGYYGIQVMSATMDLVFCVESFQKPLIRKASLRKIGFRH